MAALWLVPGLFFAAAAGELECPQAASAAGSQCGRAADADQASDDVAMLSVDHRSFLSTRSGSQSASQESDATCFCAAKKPTKPSERPSLPYGYDLDRGWKIGCQETGDQYCVTLSAGDQCDSCCTTPEEDSGECRQASNPEQAATGTVDYNTIVNILPSLPPALVPSVNGFMATGCVGDGYFGGPLTQGYLGNSAVFRSLFFNGVRSCEQAQGFYFRAPPNSGRGGCIKYGDDVVIAQTANTGNTANCGWFGCRVAGMQDMPTGNVAPAVMTFDHGGDAPMVFYLQPPVGSGRSGCIQKGDDVVIAQTGNIANTPNCGWYGCRVAITNADSGYRSLFFDHGGESPPTFVLTAAPSR